MSTGWLENEPMSADPLPQSEIILYQTEDGRTRVQCRFENETVWLSQQHMTELFQTSKQNVSLHIQNIVADGELREDSVVKESLTTAADGKNYATKFYNLDVIISVGYRVKSLRGTQFRIWATQRLREYIVKGFTMDDERLKQSGGGAYFDELLERIRDIRSSEKAFWRKVLDIYATSADYDPRAEASQAFFATVQNKMHWAAHGQTAAEVIAARADAGKPNMGLMTWPGSRLRKTDVAVAKNYLNEKELGDLNLIVSLYLDFAELQARSRRVMTMHDWIAKLDDFMRVSDREILTHAGNVSHEAALARAEAEIEKFRRIEDAKPSPVEQHFIEAIEQVKQIEKGQRAKKKKP